MGAATPKGSRLVRIGPRTLGGGKTARSTPLECLRPGLGDLPDAGLIGRRYCVRLKVTYAPPVTFPCNAVDDSNQGNLYENCLFWQNTAPGGWPPGARFELDLASGVGVSGCHIGGQTLDLKDTIDASRNVFNCPDPKFDASYTPQANGFENVGYRPVEKR